MSVQKFLDCVTNHVTATDRDILGAVPLATDSCNPDFPVRVIQTFYGWLVYVTPDAGAEIEERLGALKAAGMSEAFCNLYCHAAENDCWLINFDRDAAELDGFPVFDW